MSCLNLISFTPFNLLKLIVFSTNRSNSILNSFNIYSFIINYSLRRRRFSSVTPRFQSALEKSPTQPVTVHSARILHSDTEFQEDINAVQNWVATNKMELAVDNCAILNKREPEKDFELLNQNLNSLQSAKDLGINVSKKLTWSAHINARLNKANRVLHLIRRNVAYAVKPFNKLGLYKSLVLPVLLYGINCTTPSKSDLGNLEKLQRKAVRSITGRKNQLRLLNILPLPMYMQMNDLFTLSKLTQEGGDDIEIPGINKVRERGTELYKLRKVRLEKARNEFVFKNC